MKKEWVKKLIISAAALLVIAVMVIVYFCAVKPKPIPGSKTVTLQIVYADEEFKYEDLTTDQEYLAGFMEEYNERLDLGFVTEQGAWGLFVTGMKNTFSADGFDYTYLINGEMAMEGVSSQPIADGDVIRFEYCKTTWDESFQPISKEFGKLGTQNNKMPKETVILIAFGCVGGALVLGVAAYWIILTVKKRQNGSGTETQA